ncbi:SAVED domain-containing protein [Neorhizobium alkalisoli]|uniref:SAVED domain-containing protein n=1 Tax=Neorhizobium alkalisoli TaxID=528178 RepID=UPI000CFA72CB|nr:SAVED domain-containing protein [Neorhizobium alkalisoli]
MDRETVNWVIREFVKFLFRPKGFEGRIAAGCVAVLVTLLGWNWIVKATAPDGSSIEVGSTNAIPEWVQWPLVSLFAAIFLFCVWVGWKRFLRENELRNRKKVIVIEGRGLREDDGSPLTAAAPSDIVGHRIGVLLDLRQRKDGVIVDPGELLHEVDATRRTVQQQSKHGDAQDVTLVYGGLTPVPLTFLTGIMFDDEGRIVVMDWDRDGEAWRSLDGADDGQRFHLEGVDGVGNATEVVLAVSVSYQIRSENIATTFTHPVVRLSIPDLNSPHWSQAKQSALASQFLAAVKALEARGVTTIHLLLAAQNSVVFNLGRRYDKRNLPSLIAYQYEAGNEKKYPWGVRMPIGGESLPSIVKT